MISKINKIIKTNKNIATNIAGAFVIRGAGMLMSLVSMPLYINYFSDNKVLGVWFTILNILGWICSFDLGIGNGLRNKLTIALANHNPKACKDLISSSYFMLGVFITFLLISFLIISYFANWNYFLNIEENVISPNILRQSINITMIGVLIAFFLRLINSILFALQLSSITNLLTLITSIITVIFLFVTPSKASQEDNLITLSYAQAFANTMPLIVASIIIFTTKLKDSIPSFASFNLKLAKSVLSLGGTFLAIQILYMAITATNEWFITKFYGPEYCVEYSFYYRVFAIISILYRLALTPLWSAVTKAYGEKNFTWILKLRRILNISAVFSVFAQILLIPLFPFLFKIWLGDNAPEINYGHAIIFTFYNSILLVGANFSIITNGLGIIKPAMYTEIFALAFKIILIYICSNFINNWSIVVLISAISMIPFCIVQSRVTRDSYLRGIKDKDL